MKFLITGGTGFIGTALVRKLLHDGHEIIILTRVKKQIDRRIVAVNKIEEISSDQKIEIMINLAGAPIDRLWTRKYKNKLIESRISVTESLLKLTEQLNVKPKLLINASAIGYYGVSNTPKDLVEENSICDNSFTHTLCKQWEEKGQEIQDYDVRVCIARLGIVLGSTGGIVKKMLPIIKYGLGSILGNGKQYMSWVALEDVIRAFELFISDSTTKGVYNITSPNPVTNEEFTKTFASALNTKIRLRIPQGLIKIIFGQMGKEILLNGSPIFPKKLQRSGFEFSYPNIKDCFKEIISNNRSE